MRSPVNVCLLRPAGPTMTGDVLAIHVAGGGALGLFGPNIKQMRSKGDIAGLVSLLSEGKPGQAAEAKTALVDIAAVDFEAVWRKCFDEFDVLAAMMIELGERGVACALSAMQEEAGGTIMTHMLARLAIAGVPGALDALRRVAESGEHFEQESARVWLDNRFDAEPPSAEVLRPPGCYDDRYGTARFWFAQGVLALHWERCPSCGHPLDMVPPHGAQCVACKLRYVDASYKPITSVHPSDYGAITGYEPWRPCQGVRGRSQGPSCRGHCRRSGFDPRPPALRQSGRWFFRAYNNKFGRHFALSRCDVRDHCEM